LPGARVLPHDVGIAVVIEIARSDYLPGRARINADEAATNLGVAVHLSNRDLAGARAPPKNVGIAVVIEIACSDNFPARARNRFVPQTQYKRGIGVSPQYE